LEDRSSDNQRREAVWRFIAPRRAELARQGSVAATWRCRAGRRTGPYFLLVTRDESGERRSVYLGLAGPLVDAVRAELARLQAPGRERKVFSRVKRQLRSALCGAKQELGRCLAHAGLWRKGCEIRGWRARPARLALRATQHETSALVLLPPGEGGRRPDEGGWQANRIAVSNSALPHPAAGSRKGVRNHFAKTVPDTFSAPNVATRNSKARLQDGVKPVLLLITTADTVIGADVIAEASNRGIRLRQAVVEEIPLDPNGNYLQIGAPKELNAILFGLNFIALPPYSPGKL